MQFLLHPMTVCVVVIGALLWTQGSPDWLHWVFAATTVFFVQRAHQWQREAWLLETEDET